jgi:antirestriction protein ArdC
MHAQPDQRKRDMKNDVYAQVTDRIIADLEKGDLTWLKPWIAGNTAGRITRPLHHNGLSYGGISSCPPLR